MGQNHRSGHTVVHCGDRGTLTDPPVVKRGAPGSHTQPAKSPDARLICRQLGEESRAASQARVCPLLCPPPSRWQAGSTVKSSRQRADEQVPGSAAAPTAGRSALGSRQGGCPSVSGPGWSLPPSLHSPWRRPPVLHGEPNPSGHPRPGSNQEHQDRDWNGCSRCGEVG